MKKASLLWYSIAILVGLLSLSIAAPAQKKTSNQSPRVRVLSSTEIAKKILPSVASVLVQDASGKGISLGSGFYISSFLLATNYHVVSGLPKGGKIVISIGDEVIDTVSHVAWADATTDLALLLAADFTGKHPPLQLAPDQLPQIGEQIYAVGNPKGLESTFSSGLISGFRRIDERLLMQITAPISPGSSGGPILNKTGFVVGVAVGSIESGQNLNFAVPVKDLNRLIDLTNKLQSGSVIVSPSKVEYPNTSAEPDKPTSPPPCQPDPKRWLDQKESLRCISEMGVVVENIPIEISGYGITKGQILTDTQLRLRRAGISVCSDGKDCPYLNIHLGIMKIQDAPIYVYSIELSFIQSASLERSADFLFMTETWSNGALGYVGEAKIHSIRDALADYTDRFINDYLSVNSR